MTPLRLQMIEDMKSAGLAAATQTVYIDAVRRWPLTIVVRRIG